MPLGASLRPTLGDLMDWIKVLNRHILLEYNDLRDSEFAAWIKIMALAASLEHEPSREQMLKYVHHATLQSLDDKLMNHSCTLHEVLMKVLCDVHDVSMKREQWKQKKKQQRLVIKNVQGDVPRDVSGEIREEKSREENKDIKDKEPKGSLSPDDKSPADGNGKIPPCPQQEIVALYHEKLPSLPRVKTWADHLQVILRTRWKEDPQRQTLRWWACFFEYIQNSDFLMGRTDKPFTADLEWLIRPKNFTKIANGRYHKGLGVEHRAQPGIEAWLKSKEEKSAE